MEKLWAGRTNGITDTLADDFNSSMGFDSRMYAQDIRGSIAHASMLGAQGIITPEDAEKIIEGLGGILSDLNTGALQIDGTCEDIHMFVEQTLTERIGDAGKRLHTARSRNDQVALDLRMYLRGETDSILGKIKAFLLAVTDVAEKNTDAVMPGYTHLQRAQPILFSHEFLAYGMMLLRDMTRLEDCRKRMNVSPIGSCALAGTTYPIDRQTEAGVLGFDSVCLNSIDGVSDRDFCIELVSCLSILMMHLSRLSEELILWSSGEFGFIELDDAYTTGSSIMPQKKNSDMAELIRGKTGRVYGDLMTILTVMKGLPLAYNKDMQEDKECVFDACDTVKKCLDVCTPMIASMKLRKDRMLQAARDGFINATDLADYLVRKGLPFRQAYKICGEIVSRCLKENLVLETLPLKTYRRYSALFEEDLYPAIDLMTCVNSRTSEGGTGPDSVKKQIEYIRGELKGKKSRGKR